MDISQLFDLESHGADTFVGIGPRYPWGGLYGGQIVAQALRAAAATVDVDLEVHSLRSYFIRRGDHTEPIRYEVDRIRNGRSFSTRRVIARQAVGAILNLEASFQRPELSIDLQTIAMPPGVPSPESLQSDPWSPSADRRIVPQSWSASIPGIGSGRTLAWVKVNARLDDDQLLHRCWLAYLSDDFPADAVQAATEIDDEGRFVASLDHTIWFHRPVRADNWHLHDFACVNYVGGRGLAIGHVFSPDGVHVATVAQEVLLRGGALHRLTAMSDDSLAQRVNSIARLTGTFTLRSGQVATEYFDKYRFEADPVLLADIAAALAPLLPPDTEVLAGLELGGVPIATALSLHTGLPAAFVRKEAKAYGTAQLAEGADIHGKRVTVIEDVITTGGQVVISSSQLRALGAIVHHVVCVIDRSPDHGAALEAEGLTMTALLTRAQLDAAESTRP